MERFDTAQNVTVHGTVKRIDWVNPHVYIYVAESVETGSTTNDRVEWEVEGFPPAIMRRQGWSRSTLRPGDVIAVSGNPARDAGVRSLYPTSIRKAEDMLYDQADLMVRLGSAGAPSDASTSKLEGTWVTLLAMPLILAYVQPKTLELTPAALTAIDGYDEETMLPGLRCIPGPAPSLMFNPDIKQISVQGDTIVIGAEFDAAVRTVHMNVSSHQGAERSIQGHSIGRWERGTLVIDTTHFADHRNGHGWGLPSGPRKHLIERLTLNDDGKGLTYRFEVTDPDYLAAPFTGEAQWAYRPGLELTFEPCDLENARRFTRN